MYIPRCMSTQHPDNVNPPFFSPNSEIKGEDEVTETYYVFSHLGCDEQMWDCEGKEVDNYVVKKLLTKYELFFRENKLGKDVFLTLRVPNPAIERAESKILIETLESIPRSYDTAKVFYGEDIAPIFEVILPMTTSANDLNRIYYYYKKFVAGKEKMLIRKKDITVKEWIGSFKPKEINVIPLFEDYKSMLNSDKITENYLRDKNFEYQRVFLARSDPAMNYGMISALLLNKIALMKLDELAEKISIDIYPIIGIGSAPFRGNLKPKTVDQIIAEYPSVHTFTIQSSFKYDNPPSDVSKAIKKLKSKKKKNADIVDIEKSLDIINKYTEQYQKQITNVASIINRLSRFVPSRRKRKLHIGLFGYSRKMGNIVLPRAITFTCVLYSIGVPPEILGFDALSEKDIDFLSDIYVNFEKDFYDALKYLDWESPLITDSLKKSVREHFPEVEEDRKHVNISRKIYHLLATDGTDSIKESILEAANLRKFLG